jgi:hypothetical protein
VTAPFRIAAVLTLALAALLTPAAAARAATGEEAVARLNAQRAAHGIPAGISHNPEWSRWCALHNEYQRLNGGNLTHYEEPGKPGYTPEGAEAGMNSVLSQGDDWNSINPWETAPIHLHQTLAPRLDAMGVDDSGGYVCATTLLSRNRPAPAENAVYVYPGPGTTHRSAETAAELPYTPGQRVGIAAGTETGPYIYVSVDGPQLTEFSQARIVSASLTGPDGAVELRTVDNHTDGLEGYLPAGGELIPLNPLRPRSTYTASVSLVARAGETDIPFERTWSFSTRGREPWTRWDVSDVREDGISVYANATSPAPIELTATRDATGEVVTTELQRARDTDIRLAPGSWSLCIDQAPTGEFDGAGECWPAQIAIVRRVRLKLGKRPAVKGSSLLVPARADAALSGRTVKASIKRYKRVCKRGRCTQRRSGAALTRTVAGSESFQVKVPRPAAGGSVNVRLTAASFADGDVPVRVEPASRTYGR